MANTNSTISNQTPQLAPDHPCKHCSEPVGNQPIMLDEHAFCCEGCKMVYSILSENDMCRYYDIDPEAGMSLKGKKQSQFAYLDDEKVITHLLDYQQDDFCSVHFHLPQIHCSSCIWLLENLYKFNPGISKSRVAFLKKEIHLQYDPQQISLRQIVELLDSIGYTPAINFSDLDSDKRPLMERSFFYKLGVAGFAFGNIMLLSFPEYLGLEKGSDPFFFQLFGYLNIVLALPLVFYSGRDYLLSAWVGIQKRHLNIDVPISLGILTLFGRSVFEIITHTGAGYLDSLAGLVFFLLIGKWFQQRTYHKLSFERDYKSYFPIAANLLKDGIEKSITLDQLNVGDVIRVRNQEIIPADGLLMSGHGQIDYSFVSGESEPIEVTSGENLFAGGRQTAGTIEVKLSKKVSQSYLTQLWNDDAFTKEADSATSALADKVGRYFTITILLIAGITLFYWLPINTATAVNAFTAVLIIACPCAVALAIPFIFGNAVRILGRQAFYLKNTGIVERLAQFSTVILDKTGTLTTTEEGDVKFHGNQLDLEQWQIIGAMTQQSNHPASKKINRYLVEELHITAQLPLDYWEEIPGKGLLAFAKKQELKLGSAAFIGLEGQAAKGVYFSIDGTTLGYFEINNPIRKGLHDLLDYFREKAKVYLLSGDNERELDRLRPYFEEEQLHFHQSPTDKMQFIKSLQTAGEEVVMLGDGLNDAGALKQSDVGIVITENTNNFTPASDAILRADQFEHLPVYLRFARNSIQLVYMAYGLAFVYNIIGLSFAVQGLLSPIVAAILMPASSISIVLFGMLSSNMVARKMGLLNK